MRSENCSFGHHWCITAAIVALVQWVAVGQELEDVDARDPYPLPNCVILGSPRVKGADVLDDNEREIRVCCEECVDDFSQNPSMWISIIDDQIKEQQGEYYPLTKCVVDDAPAETFELLDVVFRNRLFRVCGLDCQDKLAQAPAKYFARLNKAVIEEQKPRYPLTKCIVSGKRLGKHAIDHVVANQLVRLAGPDQLDEFNETPGRYLADLRKAAKNKTDK